MNLPKIYYSIELIDDVEFSGWRYEGGHGLFDSFTSALAASMGLWDEYCDYHRNKSTEIRHG